MPTSRQAVLCAKIFVCIVAASAQPLYGQEASTGASASPSAPPIHTTAPTAMAARRAATIAIDGRLDEKSWELAAPITTFRQWQPAENSPATVRTEVRILYDDDALYIGARMYDDAGPKSIHAPLARRDQLLDATGQQTTDKFIVELDPYHNHVDHALFEVTPVGVKGDALNDDPSWDPVWDAATTVDSLGWSAETRIPFSQLRFSRDSVQTWGMQLWRYTDRLNERDVWSFWRRKDSGGAAFYGHPTGITIDARVRHLELLPYALSRVQSQYAPSADPFNHTTETKVRAGGDVKYLLTSNLTLDATVNPDFGQVEVDPSTLNLTAFETYFSEKRPFFIADQGAFAFDNFSCAFCTNTSSLNVFYSRRIGRAPQLNNLVSSEASYADLPDAATILGAAKVTGRTSSGYTIGLLDAVTNRETARYRLEPGGPDANQVVEPLTNYFVGRVRKEFRDGATTVGAIATSTDRRLEDSTISRLLRGNAHVVGSDFSHTWSDREYALSGQYALAEVLGSPASIAATERSSAHYFQRPDRKTRSDGLFGARYDTTSDALRGYGLYTRIAKDHGDWLWEAIENWRSPGFEVNDLAYLDRADYKWMAANVLRQWTIPGSWYRNGYAGVGGQQQYNYDGDLTQHQREVYAQAQLKNLWTIGTWYEHITPVQDDHLTRGGPTVQHTGYDRAQLFISTDPRKMITESGQFQASSGVGARTHGVLYQGTVSLTPSSSLFLSFAPTFISTEDAAQYVTRVADPTATAFYGRRYVFAYLRSETLSLDTRVNWTFTPNLTLQLYAQPFFATASYDRFREFVAPRALKKVEYGRDVGTISFAPASTDAPGAYTVDPDGAGPAQPFSFFNPNFSERSLVGNAVLRWEYRPGSTIFVVWTQQRAGFDGGGTFDFTRERIALLRDRPTNVFQIKLNYWIGR